MHSIPSVLNMELELSWFQRCRMVPLYSKSVMTINFEQLILIWSTQLDCTHLLSISQHVHAHMLLILSSSIASCLFINQSVKSLSSIIMCRPDVNHQLVVYERQLNPTGSDREHTSTREISYLFQPSHVLLSNMYTQNFKICGHSKSSLAQISMHALLWQDN